MTQTPDITLGGVEGQKGLAPRLSPTALSSCGSSPSVSTLRASIAGVVRRIALRLSIRRGIRRQRIARQIRSADVKRGLRTASKGERG